MKLEQLILLGKHETSENDIDSSEDEQKSDDEFDDIVELDDDEDFDDFDGGDDDAEAYRDAVTDQQVKTWKALKPPNGEENLLENIMLL